MAISLRDLFWQSPNKLFNVTPGGARYQGVVCTLGFSDIKSIYIKWTATAVLALICLVSYLYLGQQIEIDSCLDSGGSYDHKIRACNFE